MFFFVCPNPLLSVDRIMYFTLVFFLVCFSICCIQIFVLQKIPTHTQVHYGWLLATRLMYPMKDGLKFKEKKKRSWGDIATFHASMPCVSLCLPPEPHLFHQIVLLSGNLLPWLPDWLLLCVITHTCDWLLLLSTLAPPPFASDWSSVCLPSPLGTCFWPCRFIIPVFCSTLACHSCSCFSNFLCTKLRASPLCSSCVHCLKDSFLQLPYGFFWSLMIF